MTVIKTSQSAPQRKVVLMSFIRRDKGGAKSMSKMLFQHRFDADSGLML